MATLSSTFYIEVQNFIKQAHTSTTIRFYVSQFQAMIGLMLQRGRKSQGNHQRISHFNSQIIQPNRIIPKTNKISILSKFYSVYSANLQKFYTHAYNNTIQLNLISRSSCSSNSSHPSPHCSIIHKQGNKIFLSKSINTHSHAQSRFYTNNNYTLNRICLTLR